MTESDLPPVVLDPEKVDQLMTKLGKGASEGSPTISDDPSFDGCEIDPKFAHLYKRAKVEDTPEGAKWIVEADEYFSAERRMDGTGLDKRGRPRNLGEYMHAMEMSPEGWKCIQVIPSVGGMAGLLFRRTIKYALPDPVRIDTQAAVNPMTDEELAAYDERAKAWEATPEGAVEGA